MSKGKKIALIVSMVAVLVVAAVLNVTLLATNNNEPTGDVVQTSFFTTSRLDRQATRDYEINQLNEIIAMEGDQYEEARQNALAKKQELVSTMETEMLIETILKARGFNDVLVAINSGMESASVIVDKDVLDEQDTAIIYTVVSAESGIGWNYIKILSV